jgi:hypothetical protein
MNTHNTIKLEDLPGLSASEAKDHLEYRLASRVKPYHVETVKRLVKLAESSNLPSIAVCLNTGKKSVSQNVSNGDDSNGEVIVVIARAKHAQTVMYRRAKQDMSREYFHVSDVVKVC